LAAKGVRWRCQFFVCFEFACYFKPDLALGRAACRAVAAKTGEDALADQAFAQVAEDSSAFNGTEKRAGADRRSGSDRRTLTLAFEGPEKRVQANRRTDADRRLRRAGRRGRR